MAGDGGGRPAGEELGGAAVSRSSRSTTVAIGPARIEVAGVSDRGPVREQNQDVWAQVTGRDGRQITLVLADGMGGQRGGLEAATAAVAGVTRALESADDAGDELAGIIAEGSREVAGVRASVGGEPGTTLVIAVISLDRATVAGIGDSRAYLVREGGVRRLTTDHSWTGERVAAGLMGEAEARRDPRRNIITRAVLGDPVSPDVVAVDLEPGDVVLLCTDGAWEPLEDERLGAILGGGAPLAERLERACDAALAAGSRDNVTLAAARLAPERVGPSRGGETGDVT